MSDSRSRIDQACAYLGQAMKEAKAAGVSVSEFDERVSAAARLISAPAEREGDLAEIVGWLRARAARWAEGDVGRPVIEEAADDLAREFGEAS